MEKLNTYRVKVSGRGVRYGVLIKELKDKGFIVDEVI